MIDRIVISSGACIGANGSAAATAYSPHVSGKVQAIHVNYSGGTPATTDITLSDENDPAAENILTIANNATNIKIYPRRLIETNDGTDLTYNGTQRIYDAYVVHGRLRLDVVQANTNNIITVTVWLES